MAKTALAALILGFFVLTSNAQDGFIAGRVTGRATRQPLATKVRVDRQLETTTDADGRYRLQVKPGVYDLTVEGGNGFGGIVLNKIAVTGGRDTVVDVELDVDLRADVEVRSEVFAASSEQPVSATTLRREELRTTPGTGGDPLRALNSLPEVTAASGEFADLIVRGGTPDENLTYVDNIPIRDFTYFTDAYDGPRGGRASILAPDVFERAEFSAGGFGARYGDRLSSALDVTIREANRRKVQGVLFADSGTLGGSLDVPITNRGSWLFSARRSYIDVALDVAGIADQGIIGYPRTLDFTNKFVYDLTPRNKLTFTALNFFEAFEQSDEQSQNIDRRTDRFRMRRTSQRHTFGSTLHSTVSSRLLAQTTVYANVNHNDGNFFIPFTSVRQRSRDLRDSQFGFKEDVSFAAGDRLNVRFGGSIYADRVDYYTFEAANTFFSPLEEEFAAPRRENRFRPGRRTSGFVYVQGDIDVTNRLTVSPGVRVDRYAFGDRTVTSPRFAARFTAGGGVSMNFAAGVYYQPPGIFQLSLTPANANLRPARATHIIGGVDWLVRGDIRVRAEAYSKSYDDLVVQQIGPTPSFVADGRYFNTGSGSARGFEISARRALTGRFTGQASYGFVRSRRSLTEGGISFPSDLERPHQLTLIGIGRFYGFDLAAKYRLASGLPYTRRNSITVQGFPGTFLQRVASAADINAVRLPNFASLDIRAERRFSFKRVSISPYIDIFNVTNHDTVVQPNYEFFRRTPQFLRENKRLPIFGFRFEF
jgi:outer membrane receptor protein involved in Fe transport